VGPASVLIHIPVIVDAIPIASGGRKIHLNIDSESSINTKPL
jgi:hypothetical protein